MRVLIVEDEPDLMAALAQSLREEGYAVDTASDGKSGLFKARSSPYDALVLDLMLPALDGWAVLKELRQDKNPVPVLILTARDTLPDRVRGLDAGADDYLLKPFGLAELLARIRALIRRSAGKTSSIMTFGDVVVDTTVRTITKAGRPVELTSLEYALVEFMGFHAEELVTRSMIYDHLFEEDADSLSNLLDVHVHNIRKKLGKDFIVTRRGQGFRIQSVPKAQPESSRHV